MKDVLDDIDRWRADGHRIAVARVIGTEGSGPREAGATMAVNDAGPYRRLMQRVQIAGDPVV